MKITALDLVKVKDPDVTDTGADEVLQRRTAEASGADDGDACCLELELTGEAEAVEDHLTAIAFVFVE